MERSGGPDPSPQPDRGLDPQPPRPTVLHLLAPDERLHIEATAMEGVLALTDRRLVISDGARTILDLAYEDLRRIQYDVELDRAATLVIVPQSTRYPPQVLTIPDSEYRRVADAIALIAERFGGSRPAGSRGDVARAGRDRDEHLSPSP